MGGAVLKPTFAGLVDCMKMSGADRLATGVGLRECVHELRNPD
jgi:hypothetical protein